MRATRGASLIVVDGDLKFPSSASTVGAAAALAKDLRSNGSILLRPFLMAAARDEQRVSHWPT